MTTSTPQPEFDAYSGTYDDAVNASVAFSGLKVDFFTRVKADYIKDVINGHFADPATVDLLDIGCGVGNYHPHLAGSVGSIHGVDVSRECIATAESRNPAVRYMAYDGVTLPYPDASFDVAYTICVMHHVPPARWATFATEMRRVLRPGGLALVFEHNPFNPLTRRAVSSCVFDKDAVLLRASATEALLRATGLAKVESRYILTVPPANRLLRRVDGLFAGIPFGAQYMVRERSLDPAGQQRRAVVRRVGGDPVSRFVVTLVDRVIRSVPALEPFRTIAETIARFAGVGGASSILYAIVVCAAASLLHVHHDLAALCGFAVASPFNFLMHRCFTFRSVGLVQNDLVRYVVMQCANLGVSVGTMALAVDQLHLPYPVGVLTAIILIPIGTYFVMDQWVFRQQAVRPLPTPQS